MKRGRGAIPLSKGDILIAQQNTVSANRAAEYLNVSYTTYKKWARLHGVFKTSAANTGIKIFREPKNALTSGRIRLIDILDGKHPTYSRFALKTRLINAKILKAACAICGFKEKRVLDGKVPLILDFLDGDKKNFKKENLRLLCFHCCFLTIGNLSGAKRDYIY